MNAQHLKDSILQFAMQGKLVPQNPNDEPAKSLVDKTFEMRKSLVKEGKLRKKDLEITPLAIDEIPYELPVGWEWVNVDQIATVKGGKRLPVGQKMSDVPTPYIYIRVTEMKNHTLLDGDLRYISAELHDLLKNYVIHSTDLYLTIAGTIGAVGEVPEKFDGMNLTENALKLTNLVVDKRFLVYALSSDLVQSQFKEKTNKVGQPKLAMERVKSTIFPLPPLDEQKRIVAKIEELMPLVERYGKAQTELDNLNASLPSRLRQSVLQEAIQGKLVPQLDESANDLVSTLSAYKEKAIKEGSVKKKDLEFAPISADEIPFDVPESWAWLRLGDVLINQTGLSYKKEDLEVKSDQKIRVLRGGNIQSGSWCIKSDDVMIAPCFVKKESLFLQKNTFITPAVTSLENLGKTALIEEDHSDIVAGGFVLYLLPFFRDETLVKYLLCFFRTSHFNMFCQSIANKSGQAFWNLSRTKLMNMPIPLPPLDEQKRIVAKIEELFTKIDKLK